MILAALAASLSSTPAGSISAAAGAGSAATELGRTATIGVPVRTVDWTLIAPPKMDCSATRPPSPAVSPTASVITPEPILTASRPATSLPSPVAASSTAAGDFCPTSPASTSATGATT